MKCYYWLEVILGERNVYGAGAARASLPHADKATGQTLATAAHGRVIICSRHRQCQHNLRRESERAEENRNVCTRLDGPSSPVIFPFRGKVIESLEPRARGALRAAATRPVIYLPDAFFGPAIHAAAHDATGYLLAGSFGRLVQLEDNRRDGR